MRERAGSGHGRPSTDASAFRPFGSTSPVVFNNRTTIQTASQNVTVLAGPVAAGNLLVYIIDQVLALPQTISQVAGTLFPSLAGVIQQAGILGPLEAIKGVTIFAPNDAAIAGVMSALGSLNQTDIATILANHVGGVPQGPFGSLRLTAPSWPPPAQVINGSVVYSTQLASANYTSAAGERFMFTTNSSGAYVMSGTASAKIVQPNIVVANGVIHVSIRRPDYRGPPTLTPPPLPRQLIDNVLVNTAANMSAADSAQSSYSMAATATSAGGNGGGAIGSATMSGAPGASSSAPASAGFATVAQSSSVLGLLAAAVGLFAL